MGMAIGQSAISGPTMNVLLDCGNAMEITIAHPERGVAGAPSMRGLWGYCFN
jgi:hypothetical protein